MTAPPTTDLVRRWRMETPGAERLVHLNNAGAALVPRPVADAVSAHLRLESELGGYEAADLREDAVRGAHDAVGRLLGTKGGNIALLQNSTFAFMQALAAFDFRPGDVLLTSRADYASNQIMYLALYRRLGVEVVRVPDAPEGGIDPAELEREVARRRPALVAVTWVPTNSGLVQPVETLGEVAETAGVPYLVDGCQAVGQIPVNVAKLRCDFFSGTARKFLRGPRGIGFLYVSDRALQRGDSPLYIDMRGADWVSADDFAPAPDARRFENWEFAYSLVLGLGEAARYALAVGVERGGGRARDLATTLRRKLAEVSGIRVLDRGSDLAALVTVEVAGWDATELSKLLRTRGINTSASLRAYAVIDMDEKRVSSALRLSPHYYNTEEEIERAVAELRSVTARSSTAS